MALGIDSGVWSVWMAAPWMWPTPPTTNKPTVDRASRGASAYPKIRFVGLLENGTHVLWAARMDKYKTDEITLASAVVPALRKDMLCLADRFFPAYDLWRKAAQTGADLLWRVRKNARLEVDQRLADGSYLSRTYRSISDRRNGRKALRQAESTRGGG